MRKSAYVEIIADTPSKSIFEMQTEAETDAPPQPRHPNLILNIFNYRAELAW